MICLKDIGVKIIWNGRCFYVEMMKRNQLVSISSILRGLIVKKKSGSLTSWRFLLTLSVWGEIMSDYVTVRWDYDSMRWDYVPVRWDYDSMRWDYVPVRWDYDSMRWDYVTVRWDYDSMRWDYVTVRWDYDSMRSDYVTVMWDYVTVMFVCNDRFL